MLVPIHAHVMHAKQPLCTGMGGTSIGGHRGHIQTPTHTNTHTHQYAHPNTHTHQYAHPNTHTLIHRASGTGHYPIIKLLIERAKVPVDPRDSTGATPLLLAVQRGAQAAVIYLVSKGADMEVG